MKNFIFISFFSLICFGPAFGQNNSIDCHDANAIKQYLEKNGFEATPTTIIGTAEKTATGMVKDYAQLVISEDGLNINMAQALQKDIRAAESEGFNAVLIVTKNENFCDNEIRKIIFNNFDRGQYDTSINVHIWDAPDSPDDLLFIRYNPVVIRK